MPFILNFLNQKLNLKEHQQLLLKEIIVKKLLVAEKPFNQLEIQ